MNASRDLIARAYCFVIVLALFKMTLMKCWKSFILMSWLKYSYVVTFAGILVYRRTHK